MFYLNEIVSQNKKFQENLTLFKKKIKMLNSLIECIICFECKIFFNVCFWFLSSASQLQWLW